MSDTTKCRGGCRTTVLVSWNRGMCTACAIKHGRVPEGLEPRDYGAPFDYNSEAGIASGYVPLSDHYGTGLTEEEVASMYVFEIDRGGREVRSNFPWHNPRTS